MAARGPAQLKLVPTRQLAGQLQRGCLTAIKPLVSQRVGERFETIKRNIQHLLFNIFEETEVAKSLRGIGSVDLAAHLGLADSLASELADGMRTLLCSAVQWQGYNTGAGGKRLITIRAGASDWQKYRALPGAEYVSSSENYDGPIPVSQWLLVNPYIDIGQAAYDIVFDGSVVDLRHSRSGRALMVHLSKLSGGSAYILPDIVRLEDGRNFIEYALQRPDVATRILEIVLAQIR